MLKSKRSRGAKPDQAIESVQLHSHPRIPGPAMPDYSITPEAIRIDQLILNRKKTDDEISMEVMKNGASHFGALRKERKLPWPSYLYVPSNDEKEHLLFYKPSSRAHLYEVADVQGIGSTNIEGGVMNAFRRGDTLVDQGQSEAMMGILYRPLEFQSVVSFEPELFCNLLYRHDIEVGNLTIDPTRLRIINDVTVAAFEYSAALGIYDYIDSATFTIHDTGLFSYLGRGGLPFSVTSELRPQLRASVVIGRTYLFAVYIRVNIYAYIRDHRGQRIQPGKLPVFNVYGSSGCEIPRMYVRVESGGLGPRIPFPPPEFQLRSQKSAIE